MFTLRNWQSFNMNKIKSIKEKISRDKLEEAIESLKDLLKALKKETPTQLINLEANFRQTKSQFFSGLILENEYVRQRSKVIQGILSIVDSLEEEAKSLKDEKVDSRKRGYNFGRPLIIVLFIIKYLDIIKHHLFRGYFFARRGKKRRYSYSYIEAF